MPCGKNGRCLVSTCNEFANAFARRGRDGTVFLHIEDEAGGAVYAPVIMVSGASEALEAEAAETVFMHPWFDGTKGEAVDIARAVLALVRHYCGIDVTH